MLHALSFMLYKASHLNEMRLFPVEKQFTIRRPSSCTRRRSIRVSPIVEYSRLLPPVGVRAVSQSRR